VQVPEPDEESERMTHSEVEVIAQETPSVPSADADETRAYPAVGSTSTSLALMTPSTVMVSFAVNEPSSGR